MRKNIVHIITILFIFAAFPVNLQTGLSQNQQKEAEKKEQNPSQKTKIEGMSGIVRTHVSYNIEDFFTKEPIKIIEFQIQHLEISATNTVPIGEITKIKTGSGSLVAYHISTNSFLKNGIDVKLTPFIVEDRGIEININISNKGKTLKEETVFTRNFESVVVELLEKEGEYKKLANKITPLIHVIEPPIMFPRHIDKIEMDNHILLVKTQEKTNTIHSNRSLSAETSDGQIFMWFFLKGLGAYVLSFEPFEGAHPIGVVSDNIIRIKHNEIYLEWISRKPILPEGKWFVWVRNDPQYVPDYVEDESQDSQLRKEMYDYLVSSNYTSGIATDDFILRWFFE
ncbi:hypothetical protein ACFLRX_09430 [Acidobacteriota bacterium]